MNNDEENFEYKVGLIANDFIKEKIMKPYTYQNLLQYISECHLKKFNISTEKMMKYNLAWVLSGITIDIKKIPNVSDVLIAKTWHSEKKGPYFRREFIFRNEKNEEIFSSCSFSVLLDVEKRTVIRHFNDLPINIEEGNGNIILKDVKPTLKEIDSYDFVEKRKVYNSYIDAIGHVNNSRYGEFAFDALTNKEKCCKFSRIYVNFYNELQINDTFSVYKGIKDDMIYVQGIRDKDGKKSFVVGFKI